MLIKPGMRPAVYDIIKRRVLEIEGVWFHDIGGTSSHVHLAVNIAPTVEISTWIGKVKGGSSHDINELPQFDGDFKWQTGYGVVSFGKRDLPSVLDYIRNQKLRHDENTWEERLERIGLIDEQ